MSVIDAIREGKYANLVPYKRESVPAGEDSMTVRQARDHAEEQKRLNREQHRLHRTEEARLRSLFQSDLEAEHGLVGHPKAARLFELAWDDDHSGGFEAVAYSYAELADLVQP